MFQYSQKTFSNILVLLCVLFVVQGCTPQTPQALNDTDTQQATQTLAQAFQERRSNFIVALQAKVTRILDDDLEGSRHQRFIITLSNGQTVLVSHNIDLAPRIPTLQVGDVVEVQGEYEWNTKGGVIHWTHHDPKKRHVGGWIRHNGKVYQ